MIEASSRNGGNCGKLGATSGEFSKGCGNGEKIAVDFFTVPTARQFPPLGLPRGRALGLPPSCGLDTAESLAAPVDVPSVFGGPL